MFPDIFDIMTLKTATIFSCTVLLSSLCMGEKNVNVLEENWSIVPETTENGQEIERQKKDDVIIEGWSSWSPWTTCSRSCDGGITYSLRKCSSKTGCIGDAIRRQICNMQPCPEANHFRATQCTAYNEAPYRGRLYVWLPFHDPDDPCSLTCQADGFNFVAKLSPKVQDGTRCREGALDMCVDGQCKPVGCDLNVGSTMKIDECGVCGGDGSGCRRPAFVWAEREFSPCSVTCGGGFQESPPVCRKKDTEKEVDQRLCNLSIKPRTKVKPCNTQPCPIVWVTEDWEPCSVSCGVGTQFRRVFCAQGGPNGTRMEIKSEFCPRHKPITERSCTVNDCPRWFQGPWTSCSMTCGRGFQTRAVVCRDTRGQYSEECDRSIMPEPQRFCDTGVNCLPPELIFNASVQLPGSSRGSLEDSPPDSSSSTQLPTATASATTTVTPTAIVATTERHRLPSFVTGPWGECSVSCGDGGVRRRMVHCQLFLEFSRAIARFPDSLCSGVKPVEIEYCSTPCVTTVIPQVIKPSLGKGSSKSNAAKSARYSWRPSETFTPCTASCLGGTMRNTIHCIRNSDETEAHPRMCDAYKKPDVTVRVCNDFPCPSRWNISAYGACTKTCGGGIQTRTVKCVQEMLQRKSRVLQEVSSDRCLPPIPKSQDFCNAVDCSPQWRSESWSKCSRTCGGGFQSRKLHCEKEQALGEIIELPPSKCLKFRPKASKICNKKPCPVIRKTTTTKPTTTVTPMPKTVVNSSTSVPISFVQQLPNRRVTLKATGRAVVYKGSTVKFHCPYNEPNKTHVLWFKGQRRLFADPRTTISSRGALRLRKITFSDSGTYTCLVGAFKSDIIVSVKPLPHGYAQSVDEDDMVDSPAEEFSPEKGQINVGADLQRQNNRVGHLPYQKSLTTESITGSRKHPDEIKSTSFPSFSAWHNIEIVNKEHQENKPYHRYEYHLGGSQVTPDQYGLNDSKNVSSPFSLSAVPHVHHFLVNMRHFEDNQRLRNADYGNPRYNFRNAEKNLEFEWLVSPWSECSHTCGGSGVQVRSIECTVRYRNISRSVSNGICLDGGLQEPMTAKKCGILECPQWHTGEWTKCSESNCLSWNMAYQKRDVQCRFENGTISTPGLCDERTRPRRKRECFNYQCKGIWRVGPWTDCTATCGDSGIRTRVVQCVWYGNRLPAGNACKELHPPPITISPCRGPPCEQKPECIDYMSYCSVVKKTKLCGMSQFRLQCCASCTIAA